MSPRIWPGALCVITHPSMYGKLVEALHLAPVGVEFLLPDGYRNVAANVPGMWVVSFQGQAVTVPCKRGSRTTRYACIPGRYLRPILPPPESETTEDRAPCEVEAA